MGDSIISKSADIGEGVRIGHNCIIEDNVVIGDRSYIDSNTIIRCNTTIGEDSFIGSNCIIGEYCLDYIINRLNNGNGLLIGKNAIIRSGTIVYTDSEIGEYLSTGHHAIIREKSIIGKHVSIGSISDIQGNCLIGSYVRMHSNVHVGQLSRIDSFVWIYPYTVLTNDPTPPSKDFKGVHIYPFAVVATSSTIMPGIEVDSDTLIAAGATVAQNIPRFSVVGGCPAKVIGDVRTIKNHFTGEQVYPWREHFDTYMPWEGIGYDNWYNGLSNKEKDDYGI